MIDRLTTIMARLRDPETGCDWDVAQDFSTVAPYTIEEAYEVADAIARGDLVVRIEVETPTKLSAKQRELLEQLRATETGEQNPQTAGFFKKVKGAWG